MPLDSRCTPAPTIEMVTKTDTDSHGGQPNTDNAAPPVSKPAGVASFRVIFSFTRRKHLALLIPAYLLAAAAGTIKPLSSILVGKLMNSFSKFAGGIIDGNTLVRDTRSPILYLVALGIATCGVKGLFCFSWILYGEAQAKVVREELFFNLVNKEFEWFEAQRSGVSTLLNRIHIQIRDFQLSVSQPLGLVVLTLSQAAVSLGVAFRYNWKLSLVLLATFPLIAFSLSFLSTGLQEASDEQQDAMIKAVKHSFDSITNLTTYKCYNGLPRVVKAYEDHLQAVLWHYRKQVWIAAKQIAFMRIAATMLVVMALSFGAFLVHNTHANPGDILSTFWCCVTASKAFNDILVQMLVLEKGRAGAMALRNLIVHVSKGKRLPQNGGERTPSSLHGNIRFHNVRFAYPSSPDREILKSINIFLRARQTTFVVGQSGSGKSTISHLLLKLYSPQRGRITIDEQDLTTLNTHWLRNNVTLVQQDTILFDDTITHNISLGSQDATHVNEQDITTSVKFAMLEETLKSLPHGIDTRVGKDGAGISGGQRQRIALARARLRDSAVLILDEATSALDAHAKSIIMTNIRNWRQNRTTVIITHDMTHIRPNDRVVILEDGAIVGEGQRSDIEAFLTHIPSTDVSGLRQKSRSGRSNEARSVDETMQSSMGDDVRHYSSDVSESSSEDGTHAHSFEDNIALLQQPKMPSTIDGDTGGIYQASLKVHIPEYRRSRPSKTTSAGIAGTEAAVDHEFEMVRLARSRKIQHRLTMTQATRPYSTYPGISSRPLNNEFDSFGFEVPKEIDILDHQRSVETKLICLADISESTARSKRTLTTRQILATIWPSLRRKQRYRLCFALVSALAYSAVPAVSAWVIVHLFENFYRSTGWAEGVRQWSLTLSAIACGEAAAAFSIHFLFETSAQAWINSLRLGAFTKVLHRPKSWFDAQSWSQIEISTTLDRAAEEMRNLLGRFVPFVLIALVMISISAIWCFLTCWKLTLVGVACAPGVLIISKVFKMVSTYWESCSTEAATKVSSVFEESFADVRTVRALTLESFFHRKYMSTTSFAFATGLKRSIFTGLCFGVTDSAIPFLTAGIFEYAIVIARNGECSAKDILIVLALLISTMAGAGAILAFIPQISSSIESGTRLIQLTNLASNSPQASGASRLENGSMTGDIEFRDVNFAYPTRLDSLVLQDLNLKLEAGQCTAIVGASGSGKSTILSLILGLYTVAGVGAHTPSITVSGHWIDELDIDKLRSFIAYVSQQPVLFPMSIRDNILYGVDEHLADPDNRAHSAATSAGIHDFIMSLPNGYSTIIGEGGLRVSGGQGQRIAIARALARQPRILLLDEPTSALDPESSALIQKSIIAYKNGGGGVRHTVVVVTHASNLMRIADKVVVFDAGQVVEEGEYEDLLRSKGKLFDLLRLVE